MKHYYKPCDEMVKFRKLLDDNNIKFRINNDFTMSIYRTKGSIHENGKHVNFSVIWGNGTYGEEHGLLEVMINNNEPYGHLTAEEAYGKIKEWCK